MRKISLKNVEVKRFLNLVKRSSSMDRMMFITVKGSEFESIAYNQHKTAHKAVETDLEKICESYENECGDETVKIQLGDAGKLISVLDRIGAANVNIAFDIEDNNFAKKVYVETENKEVYVNVPCADPEAVDFLTLDEAVKNKIINDTTNLQFSFNITDSEYKYIQNLFGLNKEAVRVFFYKNGDDVFVSEIESTDENVRNDLNQTISSIRGGDADAFKDFLNYEKMYNKRLNVSEYENFGGEDTFVGCFNKKYFDWVDNDKLYTIEFHMNRMKFSSFDEENCVKTSVVLSPVTFA
jgi:hypothetical protein